MSNEAKIYHHWVEWSDEDQCFIGYCPDLANGGMCHHEDPKETYAELIDIMGWLVELAREQGRQLPPPAVRPPEPVPA